jgi:hypothetical protein
MSITSQIQKVNSIYYTMTKQYKILKTMFKNHSSILQKFVLSEQIFHQALMLITEKTEATATRREFNKIIKTIKNE